MHFFKTSNLNEMYNRFHQKLLNTINKNAPQKTMSNKEIKFQTTPWIDKNILHKIIEKKPDYIKSLWKHKIPSGTLDIKIKEMN